MDNVENIIEVSGSSNESWEQAARSAIHEASQTLEGPLSAQVLHQDLAVDGSGTVHFDISLAVTVDVNQPPGTDLTGSQTKRYLIVANQTLASAGLEHLVHELVARAPSRFHIVVPQVSASAIQVDPAGLIDLTVHPAMARDAYATARREAENRLNTFRQLFAQSGEDMFTGEVVLGDPLQAVRRVLSRSDFDEIIVSTLPAGVSKWLRMDLPHRLERAFDLPVTSLVQEFDLSDH